MKTITLLLTLLISLPMLADEALYEINTHLIVNGEQLEKQTFTTPANQMQFRIYQDKKGTPYKVLYQLQPGEKKRNYRTIYQSQHTGRQCQLFTGR